MATGGENSGKPLAVRLRDMRRLLKKRATMRPEQVADIEAKVRDLESQLKQTRVRPNAAKNSLHRRNDELPTLRKRLIALLEKDSPKEAVDELRVQVMRMQASINDARRREAEAALVKFKQERVARRQEKKELKAEPAF